MANNKFYTVEKEIGGVTYKAQFSGLAAALDAVDQSYIGNSNNTSMRKLGEYILKYIIVEPKGLTIDDFDSLEAFSEVVAWGTEVMQGNFRPEKKDEGKSK